MFRKADRKKAKLRLALCGVAGSGKTYSALRLAKGLGGKVALIDTERGSGELYSTDFDYDVAPIENNFSPENYIKLIKGAESSGYDVLIIDSLSHAWTGEGGVLDMVDKASKSSKSGNSYTAWRNVTPEHNSLVDAILQSNLHIIVTMRSKTEYALVVKDGKHIPQKMGMAPIQREGLDFEFTVVFDMSIEGNIATSSKDRTKLFNGKNIILTEEIGLQLKDWLENGKSPEEAELELFEEYKSELEKCDSLNKLHPIFAKAWKSITDERKRSVLTAIKDAKKEEFSSNLSQAI